MGGLLGHNEAVLEYGRGDGKVGQRVDRIATEEYESDGECWCWL